MNSYLRIISIIVMICFTTSCGKNVLSEEANLYSSAKKELNSKNYVVANKLFLKLSKKYPENRKYRQLLADTYLGLGGFELFDFLIFVETLVKDSFKSERVFEEAKAFVSKYLRVTKKEKKNLMKALLIYNDLDGDLSNLKEDKLKKGLVHIFLLIQSLKDLFLKIKEIGTESKNNDIELMFKKFVGKYLLHVDEMVFHSFNAYTNFKESFAEVYLLLDEIDRAMHDVFGTPYNSIREEFKDMSIEKFAILFIKYNPQIYKDIMIKLFKTCDQKEVLSKISLLEKTIISDYNNHSFKSQAFKLVETVKKYVESHEENICTNTF